jgi:apolipoprotein N-acyltransferase
LESGKNYCQIVAQKNLFYRYIKLVLVHQEQMKIALIQTSIFWEDVERNRILFNKKITAIEQQVDLIILPEMFTSGLQ